MREKVCVILATGVISFATVALVSPGTSGASGASNTFTFAGAYTGTLKLTPSSLNCSYGKAYSGKGFIVTLSHMKGTISGAGTGAWAMSVFPSKKGTTHVTKANVQSISDASLQSHTDHPISRDVRQHHLRRIEGVGRHDGRVPRHR
jgi:hypothetical protein